MVYCYSCGLENPDGANFCNACGAFLSGDRRFEANVSKFADDTARFGKEVGEKAAEWGQRLAKEAQAFAEEVAKRVAPNPFRAPHAGKQYMKPIPSAGNAGGRGGSIMSIEPDTIILHRLYPWLEKSRLRMMTFGLLVTIGLIIISYVWLTRFYSPYLVLNIFLVIIFIFLMIIYFKSVLHGAGEELQDQAPDFCPDCGSLQLGTRFCPDCGRKNI